jgi:hypothetical protein
MLANLPAWRDFNRAVGSDGSVGIWHANYQLAADGYETFSEHAIVRVRKGRDIRPAAAWGGSLPARAV